MDFTKYFPIFNLKNVGFWDELFHKDLLIFTVTGQIFKNNQTRLNDQWLVFELWLVGFWDIWVLPYAPERQTLGISHLPCAWHLHAVRGQHRVIAGATLTSWVFALLILQWDWCRRTFLLRIRAMVRKQGNQSDKHSYCFALKNEVDWRIGL